MRTKTVVALIAILALIVLLVPAKSAVAPAAASPERVNIAHSAASVEESTVHKARLAAQIRADHHKAARAAKAKRIAEAKQRARQEASARASRKAAERKRIAVKRTSSGSSLSQGTSGSNQRLGKQMAASRGWTGEQWGCLRILWIKESGWSTTSDNPSSSAYGIPQALPGSKMKSAGSDWRTNPATQIKWGLGYISSRYGTPCGAWRAFQSKGWY